ncbi:putative membrane protein [Clostridium bornimense]|uniref:Putative membrane protein n=1 Tax=Clostridium bornimense TaxID=1216932 RepID=W6RSI7_9CLOT|nr:hypothetical protein [Clostridium bornimense]CDM67551.1 putative membrane protein [Clostridium bornimense]
MTKKNFITLVLGVIGGILFGIGMCMCLLSEWNAFTLGIIVTAISAASLLALLLVRRKIDGKKAEKPNWKLIGKITFGVFGSLVLGSGMCLVMVWEMMLSGIVVGVLGIFLLLCLIPMCIGLK